MTTPPVSPRDPSLGDPPTVTRIETVTPSPALVPGAGLVQLPDVPSAREAGTTGAQAGLHEPAWGTNRLPSWAAMYVDAGQVQQSLTAINAAREAGVLYADGRHQAAVHAKAVADAPQIQREYRDAHHGLHETRAKAIQAGESIGVPSAADEQKRRRMVGVELGLGVVLVVGDTLLSAPAFDGLGLDDKPRLGTSWFDDRHIAAFVLVLAMLGVAAALGHALKKWTPVARRRLAAVRLAEATARGEDVAPTEVLDLPLRKPPLRTPVPVAGHPEE